MAKKSQIARSAKREKRVAHYAAKRKLLKGLIKSPNTSEQDREEAFVAMQKLPRDASPVRIKHRCKLTGRSKGYYRKFQISRIALRELALNGELPGVVKASW